MANKKEEYVSKAKTVSLKFSSRASVNVGKNYYTVECCEERVINPDDESVDVAKERELLWDCVNTEVDNQVSVYRRK